MTALYNKREVFQFTPLREGRPCRTRHPRLVSISIHAPPRGATRLEQENFALCKGFQFTPLREGRLISPATSMLSTLFQFTPLREGRPFRPTARASSTYFNSRPSARGDGDLKTQKSFALFQFTPLREGRPVGRPVEGFLIHFNSRPSARGDSKRYAISANLLFNPYKSAWLNNNATQFVEIILVIFHRIIA